jgi:predicted phage terminase large subunit-like protein
MQSLQLDEQYLINEAARIDLKVFTEELGYKNAPFHEEWYDKLQYKFSPLKTCPSPQYLKFLMQLWPRGHGKSEVTSFNYVSWLIGKYSDIHVNIVTKTATLSEDILRALMTRMESDKRYIEIFGELKPKNPKCWTTSELIINRREISKNPTIKATGLMGAITGGRSDLIIDDDLIDEENTRSLLQLEKALTWHDKVLSPTLYPWGGEIVIGTRWHYADLYQTFINQYPKDPPNISVKKAIIQEANPEKNIDPIVLWPSYWSYSQLVDKRVKVGSIIFDCQYQNDPTSMEGSLLKSKWLIPWEQRPPAHCRYYAGIDPSLGESDYFGIATLAQDPQTQQCYLEDVWAEHLPFPTILKEKLPQLVQQYRYSKIFMETNFWQKLLLKMPELRGLPIVPVNTVKNKEERFIPLSSHFESKRVLVNPLLLNKGEFWTEWVQFPRGQHDDAIDACFVAGTQISTDKGLVPIEKIKVNDMVLTRSGYCKVKACGFTGIKMVSRLVLEDGRELVLTSNHPIFIEGKDFIRMDAIEYVDKICNLQSQSPLTDKNITVTQTQNKEPTASITRDIQNGNNHLSSYIGQFGNFIMVQFQKVTSYIIKTAIPLITPLKTSNLQLTQNTVTNIANNGILANVERQRQRSILMKLDRKLPNGTVHKKAKNGIKNTPQIFTSAKKSQKLSHVSNAAESLLRKQIKPLSNSVQKDANGTTPYLIKPVQYAENPLRQVGAKLTLKPAVCAVGISLLDKNVGAFPVFNLTVEDTHEYFANGILVHNCDLVVSNVLSHGPIQALVGKSLYK